MIAALPAVLTVTIYRQEFGMHHVVDVLEFERRNPAKWRSDFGRATDAWAAQIRAALSIHPNQVRGYVGEYEWREGRAFERPGR